MSSSGGASAGWLRHVPIVSGFLELDKPPRTFLYFMAFNVVSWQCLAGSALVLFARHVDMPATWVGLLISFMPLTVSLVAVTVSLVERVGPKRLLMTTWLLRNLCALSLFAMPWAIGRWGSHAGWYILIGATLAFCVARAMGTGGWWPWLHELIPAEQRGTYFSTEAGVSQASTIFVAVSIGLILGRTPVLGDFLTVSGMGIAVGLISVGWIALIPGGQRIVGQRTAPGGMASYRKALANRDFLHFTVQGALGLAFMTWFGAAAILYLRDELLLTSKEIMFTTAFGGLGVAITVRFWGRYADAVSSAQAMFLALSGHSAVVLSWLTLVPGSTWAQWAAAPLLILAMIFGAAFVMATNRGALAHVRDDGRVGYTNIWVVVSSVCMGLTAILVGQVVGRWDMGGFQACFLVSGLGGLVCAVASLWVREQGHVPPEDVRDILQPSLPLRTLARIVWITAGLHVSNRGQNESDSEQEKV